MTKITFKDWEEIVVHETAKRDLADLVGLKTLYLRAGQVAEALVWAEGVVMSRSLMMITDEVIKEQLKGIIHYSLVEFAPMPTFKEALEGPSGKTIPVIDVSQSCALRDLAIALRAML